MISLGFYALFMTVEYHQISLCETFFDCKTPCSTATKGRTIVERAFNHFKINMCIAGRKTRNLTITKADVFLAGIASQLTAIVAYAMI